MKFTCFSGQKVFLFGLGYSGLATAKALQEGGAELIVWDDNAQAVAAAEAAGLRAADLRTADWRGVKALILSPGVPLTHPKPHWSAELAKAAGAEIIGDIELFFRQRRLESMERDCPIIAITGTNGKSTTTALTAHLLRAAGRKAEMGGNIGRPVAELSDFTPGQIYVLELSSYQIDLTPSLAPDVGILLNITPDHIDRHGSFVHYAEVKERLVAAAKTAIISAEDAPCRAILARLEQAGKKVIEVNTHSSENSDSKQPFTETKLISRGLRIFEARKGERRATEFFNADMYPALRGVHNTFNVRCAAEACLHLKPSLCLSIAEIKEGLKTFKGLPYRMECAGTRKTAYGDIIFINDSKATNAESVAPALRSYDNIYWIAGGRPKAGGVGSLKDELQFVKKVYLIGEAQDEFAQTLKTVPGNDIAVQAEERRDKGDVHSELMPFEKNGTLAAAVQHAVKDAEYALKKQYLEPRNAVILLSPACASFDQFKNFEQRGEAFAKLARQYCDKPQNKG